VLIGDGKELANVPRTHLPQRFDQTLDDGAEHLFRLQIERSLSQSWIAAIEQGRAELMKAPRRSGQQTSHHWLCRGITGQAGEFIQEMLNCGGGARSTHGSGLYDSF